MRKVVVASNHNRGYILLKVKGMNACYEYLPIYLNYLSIQPLVGLVQGAISHVVLPSS